MKKIKYLIAGLMAIVVCLGCLCGCGTAQGEFYSLQEAYDLGFLTVEDLEQIAYYHNNDVEYPEPLNSITDKAIRETEARNIREEGKHYTATAKDITINKYYGRYNRCYAVWVTNVYSIELCWYNPPEPIVIGGVQFESELNGTGVSIRIWIK